ncbi:MAG: TonB-dependent siderophore receptor [Alphaproteobacteria bacterium]|nr:TonB-dependent siderophore receptor [Alphaproteobacteria bacterium]
MKNKLALLVGTAIACASFGSIASADSIDDQIIVTGRYLSLDQLDSVKTPTPIIDVPQSFTIVTIDQIEEQNFTSVADVLRYTPGLSVSQGEGHRDAIIIRGNQTTADFFINGVRDDVQYYRPLYNLQQIEILRGSNALLFGRGGGGGIVNRVTKTPEIGETFTSVRASVDTFGAYSLSADTNLEISRDAAFRLNAYTEELANHRDAFDGTRYALNPTLAVDFGARTSGVFSYEYLNDDRVVDRGVPSVSVANGPDVPLEGYRDTLFGSADGNFTEFEAHILRARIDHEFNDMLRGNVTAQYADYDKLYQNIYAAGFDAFSTPQRLTLDGYRDATERENFIIQGNLIGEFETGSFGHTVLFGIEYGDQSTQNGRLDNRFVTSNDDQETVDFVNGNYTVPNFSFGPALTSRESDVAFTSLYLQDQISIADNFKVIIGARFDRFDVEVLDLIAAQNPNDDGRRARVDEEISPRLGVIWKPAEYVSFYASYSQTFLPSAGDQFLTLSTTTEQIAPQVFENREIGAKWDITPNLSLTASIFQNERGLFTTVNPNNVAQIITVAGSTTEGFEVQLVGDITDTWSINAGYSYLDSTVDGGSFQGNRTRQTPEHMFSVWNQYQATDRLSLALGMTYQDEYFVREDNAVLVPSYTRWDAAAFYDLSDRTLLQLNLENLTDEDYFPDAHSNDNISTGEPLNARLTVRHRF